jgi:hypothetical protein
MTIKRHLYGGPFPDPELMVGLGRRAPVAGFPRLNITRVEVVPRPAATPP